MIIIIIIIIIITIKRSHFFLISNPLKVSGVHVHKNNSVAPKIMFCPFEEKIM